MAANPHTHEGLALEVRDVIITKRVLSGEKRRAVSREYGLSDTRVSQIMTKVCVQRNEPFFKGEIEGYDTVGVKELRRNKHHFFPEIFG